MDEEKENKEECVVSCTNGKEKEFNATEKE